VTDSDTTAPLPVSNRIRATGVTYAIGAAHLVDRVSLDVRAGEVLLLVGPNGAGKSTLLHLLSGDLSPTAGSVALDGLSVSSYKPHDLALRRAVMPQQSFLQFAFTVREVAEMGRSPYDEDKATTHSHVSEALRLTEMLPFEQRIYPSLSGGEKSRAQLGRVLAQDTPILLLDEPTAALDLRHQQHVMDVSRLIASKGGSVIAVVHDLNLAASSADRIVLMHQGRVVADGSPWAVMEETRLSEVYSYPIAVGQHPHQDCPLIVPRRPGSNWIKDRMTPNLS
jgi:iron complex transport system ATP-binding protein